MLRKERNLSSFRKAFLFWGKERESYPFYLAWKGKGKERWFSKGIEQFLFRRCPQSFTTVVKYFNLLKDSKCIKPSFQKKDNQILQKTATFQSMKMKDSWRVSFQRWLNAFIFGLKVSTFVYAKIRYIKVQSLLISNYHGKIKASIFLKSLQNSAFLKEQ